jgi:Leucine-rich repeat (LRR) protein
MAYVKMNLAEKELERLFDSISKFKHIQYLDISSNNLVDITPLLELPNLLHLNLSKNQVKSL